MALNLNKFDLTNPKVLQEQLLGMDIAYFMELLHRLNIKVLFFGAHNPNEFRNSKVYKNFNPEQFVSFIIENSCLKEAKILIKTKDGRKIYKITS